MPNMIAQLESFGYLLLDEQQVRTMILSIPNNWVHLKVNFTHNDSIKIFYDVERLGAAKTAFNFFVTESSSTKSSGFKHKKIWKINEKDKNTREGQSKKK